MKEIGYTPRAHRAWGLLTVRLGSVLAMTLFMWFVVRALFDIDAFPPNTMWVTLGLLPVNVLCLRLVHRLYRAEGKDLCDALDIRPGQVKQDILWGLLWLVVTNAPFALTVSGTVFALYGTDAPKAFETIFFDVSTAAPLGPVTLFVISTIAVVPFMLINALTEELVFRGYVMTSLRRRWGSGAAITCTAVLFGTQHILFAATVPAMLVYFVAFTVWGLIAALIMHRQGRLFPMVIAHAIVNIAFSAPALVFPLLQLTGTIKPF